LIACCRSGVAGSQEDRADDRTLPRDAVKKVWTKAQRLRTLLDSLADRMMYRFAYRWMGSAATDQAGDIALGYSESSSAMKPAIAYTGHQASDGLNVMEPETLLFQGAGAQTGGLSRWGDYSGMSSDPSDGCTFWYTNEYIPADGSFNWHTRIGSFTFPACMKRTDSDFSMALFPTSGTIAAPGSVTTTVSTGRTAGTAQSISLSASGLPTGVTASFSAPSVTPATSSTMTLTVASGTTPGTYPITVTGTGTTTHTATFTLTVTGAAGTSIVNGGFETGDFSAWTVVTGSASVVPSSCNPPHSGTYSAWLGGINSSCNPVATSGDSSISQTFQLAQPATLSFWYDMSCPDTVAYDWATATLYDSTAGTTTTLLPKTCTTYAGWVNVTSALGASSVGHTFVLTLTSHDDNYPTDPTATVFDDVALLAPAAADFTLSATPSTRTVVAGSATSYTATVTPANGFTGTVNLTVSGLPSGASGNFTPAPVTGGSGSSTLAVTTTAATPPGTYALTITGASGSLVHSTSVTLVVNPPPAPDFTLSVTPSSRSVHRGTATTYTVTITAKNGFSGTVNLTLTGLRSGSSGSFSPDPTSSTSTLAITTTSTASTGTFTLTIKGTSGSLSHSTTATLTVTVTRH
jgi:hypothetical protein